MPIGERGLCEQRGFTYLFVLFLVAVTAAGLAALGRSWQTAAQREREAELAWRGRDIARAITAYVGSGGAQAGHFPTRLEDLVEDRRGPRPQRHLRRLWVDPFTGQPDWVLLPHPQQPGSFMGVRSRSEQALLREVADGGPPARRASDWVFSAQPAASAVPPGAPASGVTTHYTP